MVKTAGLIYVEINVNQNAGSANVVVEVGLNG
jgi:hypothetical protein